MQADRQTAHVVLWGCSCLSILLTSSHASLVFCHANHGLLQNCVTANYRQTAVSPSGGWRLHLASPDGDRNCIASRRATHPPSGSIRNCRLLALYSSAIDLRPSTPQGAATMASATPGCLQALHLWPAAQEWPAASEGPAAL